MSISVIRAGQAHRFHPEELRQARLRRFGLSSATARAVALLAYGDLADEPWCWRSLGEVAAEGVEDLGRPRRH